MLTLVHTNRENNILRHQHTKSVRCKLHYILFCYQDMNIHCVLDGVSKKTTDLLLWRWVIHPTDAIKTTGHNSGDPICINRLESALLWNQCLLSLLMTHKHIEQFSFCLVDKTIILFQIWLLKLRKKITQKHNIKQNLAPTCYVADFTIPINDHLRALCMSTGTLGCLH